MAFIKNLLLLSVIIPICLGKKSPNFVLILADDVGYGDFQCYGHATQERGAVDDLAAEGMRFTQWYAPDSLCSPSRAALLTGRYPIRSGIVGPNRVFWQNSRGGLPKSEETLAEALKRYNYTTGIVGKWHLGINEFVANDGNHLPHHHGFDYVGTLLSFSYHFRCDPTKFKAEERTEKCFLNKGSKLVQQPITSEDLTEKILNDSKSFIKLYSKKPFFLYMSMPQAHSALFASKNFRGNSKRGIYGDSINEMSWAIGKLIKLLRELHLDENTLVIFLSDHGPQAELCHHGGSAGPLRGGKASTWDGGLKVPAMAWWPGTIKPGSVYRGVLSSMDIFPTFLNLAGGETVTKLDGTSLTDVLTGTHDDAKDPAKHDVLFHYCSDQIMAVRIGPYKLHYYSQYQRDYEGDLCNNGNPYDDKLLYFNCSLSHYHDPPLIFDINRDPGEQFPLDPSKQQDLVERTASLVQKHRQTIIPVPSQLGSHDSNVQPCCNPPLCACNYQADEDGIELSKDEL
ncbi:unnamed protein product [Clavelina lepadiformis]|uniref:Sulfatase N-terminal domain-containing protein n=1 Tax=Clavelina lepadiformis TaxID=159417 RepID=A0ABP0FHM0_CLALP